MAGTDGGDRRVLLVESTGALERRFGDELAAAGFDVERVGSAAECLRRVKREDIDGVVSAYALPDLDGVRLLRSLRVSRPTLPFVLVPEDGSEAMAGKAIAAGASGYVPVECDPATLVSRLRGSLQREKPWIDAESGQRYRHLVEISPAPINLFDETGESIWCNDAVLDLLGLDGREELVGHSIFDFIHPDDHDLAREELQDVIWAKESVGPTRMRLRRPDGEVRHVQVSTAVGGFLGGDIGQAVVVDVTELRETQEALRAAREFIEETLDTLQDVFYVVDPDGELVEWNAVTTEVTGYDDAELDAMNLADLFVGDARDRVRDSVTRTLETGRDTVEAKLATKHGWTLLYELRSRRLRTGGGKEEEEERRVVGIGRDVSVQKERERQLKVLERWLRHNIRNDINVIQGTAESIRRENVGDVAEAARCIEDRAGHLVEQANRERELVDLLTNPPEPHPVEITGVIERQVRAIRERYPAADVAFDRPGEVYVRGIPGVGEAVRELVENAIEHNDAERPGVRIEVFPDDRDRVFVRVFDDGPGIPREEREVLLFEQEIDQLHHGAGLGLLFAHWVVRVSGGDIDFGENDPRGSVVTLLFRSAADEAPERSEGTG